MQRDIRSFRTIIALLIGVILVIILSLENRHGVSIQIFWWHIPSVSLALLVAICLLLGAGLALAAVWRDYRRHRPPRMQDDSSSAASAIEDMTAAPTDGGGQEPPNSSSHS